MKSEFRNVYELTACFLLVGCMVLFSILKMEVLRCSETSVNLRLSLSLASCGLLRGLLFGPEDGRSILFLEASGRGIIEVLYVYLPRVTEKHHDITQSYSCPGRDSSPTSSEHESRATMNWTRSSDWNYLFLSSQLSRCPSFTHSPQNRNKSSFRNVIFCWEV
jgi:hypothetical protein